MLLLLLAGNGHGVDGVGHSGGEELTTDSGNGRARLRREPSHERLVLGLLLLQLQLILLLSGVGHEQRLLLLVMVLIRPVRPRRVRERVRVPLLDNERQALEAASHALHQRFVAVLNEQLVRAQRLRLTDVQRLK